MSEHLRSNNSKEYVPDISTEVKVLDVPKTRVTLVFTRISKLLRLVAELDRYAVAELLLVPFPILAWFQPVIQSQRAVSK